MKYLWSLAVLAAVAVSAHAAPAAGEALAKEKGCLGCHAVDHKVVGPAYEDVAAKYAGQKDAAAKLTQKVLNGGGGVWGGPIAMPPQSANVTPEQAKQLVQWVLSLKKK